MTRTCEWCELPIPDDQGEWAEQEPPFSVDGAWFHAYCLPQSDPDDDVTEARTVLEPAVWRAGVAALAYHNDYPLTAAHVMATEDVGYGLHVDWR